MVTMAIPDVEYLALRLFAVCFVMYSPDGINVYGSRGGERIQYDRLECVQRGEPRARFVCLFSTHGV